MDVKPHQLVQTNNELTNECQFQSPIAATISNKITRPIINDEPTIPPPDQGKKQQQLTHQQIQTEETKVVNLVLNEGLSIYKALKQTQLKYKSRTRVYFKLEYKVAQARKKQVANTMSKQGKNHSLQERCLHVCM